MVGVDSVVAEPVAPAAPSPARTRHWIFLVALAGGATLRVLMLVAYWPAFWFQADSAMYINASTRLGNGSYGGANGLGYPVLLRLLSYTDSLAVVSILQHLAGLGLAVAIYVCLRRRGMPGWLATAATLPLLYDARVLGLEHYILSDTLFLVLTAGAMLLLIRRDRPSLAASAAAGVLLSAAAVSRTVGVGVLAFVLLYLLIRWVGWQRLLAYALAVLVCFGGYLFYNRSQSDSSALTSRPGAFLYSRTAQIADCSKLRLTPRERALCPEQPRNQRPERGDFYIWNDPDVAKAPDALAGAFAKQVMLQQPGDYLRLVFSDLGRYLLPGRQMGPATTCLAGWSMLPADPSREPVLAGRCMPFLAGPGFQPGPLPPAQTEHSGLQQFLHGYSKWVYTPHTALGLAVLVSFVALVWRPRRDRYRDALDAALFTGTALALLLAGVAVSLYSIRYGLPPAILLAIGGALALDRLRRVAR
jgi:hypothetical protein